VVEPEPVAEGKPAAKARLVAEAKPHAEVEPAAEAEVEAEHMGEPVEPEAEGSDREASETDPASAVEEEARARS